MRSLDGEFVLSNCCIYVPEIYFIYYDHFSRYISQLLNLTNQKICVENTRFFYFNDERKYYIFVIICQLHNINQDKIQKFMFIFLFHDLS